jgi:hypothetical protein
MLKALFTILWVFVGIILHSISFGFVAMYAQQYCFGETNPITGHIFSLVAAFIDFHLLDLVLKNYKAER